MKSWCGDETLGDFSNGPNSCFCQTIFTAVPNFLLVVGLAAQFYKLSLLPPFGSLDARTLRLFRIAIVMVIVLGSLIFALSFDENITISLYFSTVSHILMFIMWSGTLALEVWRLSRWPGNIIKIAMGVNLFSNVITLSVDNGVNSSSLGTKIIAIVIVLLNVLLLAILLLKDVFRSEEDIEKDELRLYSSEFMTSLPIRTSTQEQSAPFLCMCYCLEKRWNPVGSEDQDDENVAPYDDNHNGSGCCCCCGGGERTDDGSPWPGREPLLRYGSPDRSFNRSTNHSTNSRTSNITPSRAKRSAGDSVVESAIERNLAAGMSGTQDSQRSGSLWESLSGMPLIGGFFRPSEESNALAAGGDLNEYNTTFPCDGREVSVGISNGFGESAFHDDRSRDSFNSVRSDASGNLGPGSPNRNSLANKDALTTDRNSLNSSYDGSFNNYHAQRLSSIQSDGDGIGSFNMTGNNMGSGNGHPVMSRALMNVMESHKAKLCSTNPVLEPRGNARGRGGGVSSGTGVVGVGSAGDGPGGAIPSSAGVYRMPTAGGVALGSSGDDTWLISLNLSRWGLRRTRLHDSFDVNSSSDVNNLTHENDKSSLSSGDDNNKNEGVCPSEDDRTSKDWLSKGRSSANARNDSSAVDTPDGNTDVVGMSEIEFEVEVRAQHRGGARGGEVHHGRGGSSGAGGGDSFGGVVVGGSNSGLCTWTVWRTAFEVMGLHTGMVSLLGDLTPRRPRLRSSARASSELSNSELTADMRAIAVFLNALLRGHEMSTMPALVSFLDIDTHRDTLFNSSSTSANRRGSAVGKLDGLRLGNGGKFDEGSDMFSQVAGGKEAQGGVVGTHQAGDGFSAAAEVSAANSQRGARQEKWRKVYFHLRVKLKPRDIGIRCRLFEGVVSGGEITAYLMRPTTSASTAAAVQAAGANPTAGGASNTDDVIMEARDRNEALVIGQELLSCNLLVPICSGYTNDPDEAMLCSDWVDADLDGINGGAAVMVGPDSDIISNNSNGTASQHKTFNAAHGDAAGTQNSLMFSDMPGYIYRFPSKLSTTGDAVGPVRCWSIFGAPVDIRIPDMTVADSSEETKPTRETVGFSIFSNGVVSVAKPGDVTTGAEASAGGGSTTAPTIQEPVVASGANSSGHVKYLLAIAHGGDEWQVWRRFSEFEALSKALTKEGVKFEVSLPAKSLFDKRQPAQLENRRAGLEAFIRALVVSVVNAGSPNALTLLAQFLDEDFNNHQIHLGNAAVI